MAKFAYNNTKNASTSHTQFKFNCSYHLSVFFKEDTNPCFWSKTAEELLAELREPITVCRNNLQYAQKLQKQAHNKRVKPRGYTTGDKVWLNSKYLKTKLNRKLKAKFFRPFRVLYPVGKQAYKLKLPRKWRKHNIFRVSLVKYETSRKELVDEKVPKLDPGNNIGKLYLCLIYLADPGSLNPPQSIL